MILSLLALSTLGLVSAGPTYTTCPGGFKNGEKFTEGSFVKKCSADGMSYSVSIIGCLTPEKNEIQIGKELKEGNWVHKCIGTANGGAKIEMERATASETGPRENMKCMDKYSNGEKFTEGNFVKLCTSSPTHASVTIAACLTPAKKEISLGGKLEENKLIYSCINTGNGARMSTELAVKGCQDGKYKKGQQYLSANKLFLMKCMDDYGSTNILACMADGGKEVKVGGELTADGFKYKCELNKKDSSVKYIKEPIGGGKNPSKGCGQYAIGDKIISDDKLFQFECQADGKVKFTHCLVRGGKAIPADKQRTIHGLVYDCKTKPDGGATLTKTKKQ